LTKEEARLAVQSNAEVVDRKGIHGYVYSLSWIHHKGKKPFEAVGFHDLNANCVYQAALKDLTVTDWKMPDNVVQEMLAKMKVKTD